MTDVPAGFVVTVDPGDRIHFVDWGTAGEPAVGGPAVGGPATGVPAGILLIHGLGQTTAIWAPVARRLAGTIPVVAMDVRGHGLSDAPTEDGAYDLEVLADDAIAVAEGAELLPVDAGTSGVARSVILVGHGFGAIVATRAAERLGSRCAGLVLVDGGWERIEDATGLDVDEFLRGLDEPPEVMASMRAFLRDRRSYDPATWDADQEAAARATVVETHAGRVVPSTRPHALDACVRAMFTYEPDTTLPAVHAPVIALVADAGTGSDTDAARLAALEAVSAARVAVGGAPIHAVRLEATGHNLMRYRPSEVTAAVLALAATPAQPSGPA